MKVKHGFDNSDQKVSIELAVLAQKECGPSNYDASKARVDLSAHSKVRDMLVLNNIQRTVGAMIPKYPDDRFFVSDLEYLCEECVLPTLNFPHDLISISSTVDIENRDETVLRYLNVG